MKTSEKMINRETRRTKQVVFTRDDDELFEFLLELPIPFSVYVKQLIKKDMDGNIDYIEAGVNEILTLLKSSKVVVQTQQDKTTAGAGPKDKTGKAIDNMMSIFK